MDIDLKCVEPEKGGKYRTGGFTSGVLKWYVRRSNLTDRHPSEKLSIMVFGGPLAMPSLGPEESLDKMSFLSLGGSA